MFGTFWAVGRPLGRGEGEFKPGEFSVPVSGVHGALEVIELGGDEPPGGVGLEERDGFLERGGFGVFHPVEELLNHLGAGGWEQVGAFLGFGDGAGEQADGIVTWLAVVWGAGGEVGALEDGDGLVDAVVDADDVPGVLGFEADGGDWAVMFQPVFAFLIFEVEGGGRDEAKEREFGDEGLKGHMSLVNLAKLSLSFPTHAGASYTLLTRVLSPVPGRWVACGRHTR